MKPIPPTLQAKLDSGITTLARCWTLTRRDGARLGFTDHDRSLVLDGLSHDPDSGLDAGALDSASGLASDNTEALCALSADSITEHDLERGLYDGAEVDLHLVDWTDPADRVLLFRGSIGETVRGPLSFTAELRSMASKLDQTIGRAYLRQCDAELGDARCRLTITPAIGTVTALAETGEITATGLGTDHARGVLTWLTGANTGSTQIVRDHTGDTLAVWSPPPDPVQPGDTFAVTPGCDKTLATCRDRFANAMNFRGFPHIPGDDFVVSYPNLGEGNDGRAID